MGNLLPSLGRRKLPMLEMPKVGGGDVALGSILYAASAPSQQYALCDGGFVAIPNPAAFPLQTTFQQLALGAKTVNQASSGALLSGAFGASTFVVGSGDGYLYVSKDGGQTFDRNDSFVAAGLGVTALSYAFGVWILGTNNGNLYFSADLTTWTVGFAHNNSARTIRDICFANGMVVAVGDSSVYMRSTDGRSWTNETQSFSSYNLTSVRWCNDRFIVCAWQNSTRSAYYSTTGIAASYLEVSLSGGAANTPTICAAFGNGVYAITVNDGGNFTIFTSTNGVNFTFRGYVRSGSGNAFDLAFIGGAFVAGVYGGGGALSAVLFSYDAVSWNTVTTPDATNSTSVAVRKLVASQDVLLAIPTIPGSTLWGGPIAKVSFKTPSIPSLLSKAGAILRAFMRIS